MYNGTTCSVFSKSPVNASSYFHNLRNKEREKKQRPWDTDTQREDKCASQTYVHSVEKMPHPLLLIER